MPNWIPILIVLLTQGAGGTVSAAHPHEMVRMLRYAVSFEDVREVRVAPGAEADSTDSTTSVSPAARRVFAGRSDLPAAWFWPGAGLSRDGPAA